MLLVLIVVGNNHSDICQKNAYQVFFFFPSLFSVLPLELSQSWMKKKLIKKYFNFFVCSVASAKQKYKCCRPKRRTSSNGLFCERQRTKIQVWEEKKYHIFLLGTKNTNIKHGIYSDDHCDISPMWEWEWALFNLFHFLCVYKWWPVIDRFGERHLMQDNMHHYGRWAQTFYTFHILILLKKKNN